MKLLNVELENLGQFKSLNLNISHNNAMGNDFNKSNITVLIGNNGAGKTSILKAIATSLSWFVARLKNDKGIGSLIPEDVIMNNKSTAIIKTKCFYQGTYEWTITKTRRGREVLQKNNLQKLTELVGVFKKKLTEDDNSSLPLIAFYSVERVVLDIPLKIRSKHSFSQIDGYDNSLNQGVDFRRFFEWFREREDIENELKLSQLEELKEKIIVDREFKLENDLQLEAVRNAISQFMTDFSGLKVKRKPKLHMSVRKGNIELNVSQLSQGEKSLMALVGDIARRLVMMNPYSSDPLKSNGIILIDEIDMHLHPSWQRNIVHGLKNTFPNCQFILTTHSPLVISDSKDILVYSLDNGEIITIDSQYGQDVNSVLLGVMNTEIRNSIINDRFDKLLDMIQCNEFETARLEIKDLEREISLDNIELVNAKLLLAKKEAICNAKNR